MVTTNHNYAAKLGLDIDDTELVNRYSLDPKVAHTPAINEAVRKAIYLENIQDLKEGGFSEGQARSIAGTKLNEAKAVAASMAKQ